MKLYESFLNQLAVWQELETAMEEGTASDELLNKLNDELNKYEGENSAKALSIARVIKGCNAEADALKAEKDKLDKRIKANNRTVDYLTTYLSNFCQAGKNIEDATARIGWRKSSSVEILDETAIPAEFKNEVVSLTISKTAIKEAIASGINVAGATIVERNNIQIK